MQHRQDPVTVRPAAVVARYRYSSASSLPWQQLWPRAAPVDRHRCSGRRRLRPPQPPPHQTTPPSRSGGSSSPRSVSTQPVRRRQLGPRFRVWRTLALDGNSDKCVKEHEGYTGRGGAPLNFRLHAVRDGVVSLYGRRIPANRRDQFWGYEAMCGMLDSSGSHSQTYGYWEVRFRMSSLKRGPAGLDLADPDRRGLAAGTRPGGSGGYQSGGSNGRPGTVPLRRPLRRRRRAPGRQLHLPDRAPTRRLAPGRDRVAPRQGHLVPRWPGGLPPARRAVRLRADVPDGSPEVSSNWAGPTTNATSWPMEVQIDYVRIYQLATPPPA